MDIRAKWCLIHTKPKQEMIAGEHLKRQNYCVYLPILQKHRSRTGKRVNTTSPLFPRYLFVRLSAGIDDWGPIRSTRGVSDFVRFGSAPAKVPDQIINEIKMRESGDGLHYEVEPELRNGDKIYVTEGAFSGCNAIFDARRGKERVLILLDIIGRSSRVEVAANSIAKIDS